MRKRVGLIIVIVLAVLLTFGAYMGAYYAMLEPPAPWEIMQFRPSYRWNAVESLLEPAHQIDRRLRPSKWGNPNDFGIDLN